MTSNALNMFDNAIDKTPGSVGSWQTIDVSGDGVPVGATGVILDVHATSGTRLFDVRAKGSSDDDYANGKLYAACHTGCYVALDSSRQFEAKIDNAACKIYLCGYFGSSVTFLSSRVSKTPGALVWLDMDCSAQIPAGGKAAIFKMINTYASAQYLAIRKNGSTDTEVDQRTEPNESKMAIIGIDSGRICEGLTQSGNLFYLYGYFDSTSSIVMKTNGVLEDPSTGAFNDQDLTADTSAAANAAIFKLQSSSGSIHKCDLRKNGSTDDRSTSSNPVYYAWAVVGLDVDQICEIKRADSYAHSYLMGYDELGSDSINISDTGTGTDTVADVSEALSISETGSGVEGTPNVTEGLAVSETGAGVDSLVDLIEGLIISEVGAGVDWIGIDEDMTNVSDVGLGIDAITLSEFDEILSQDVGVGIDRVWLYRSQLVIDSYPLPHVDSAEVVEPSIVATKPSSSSPLRLWRGKRGRQVTIKGRADTQAEITAIKALNDGAKHALHLPTGDSFRVLITDVKPDDAAESPNQIAYVITVKETT